MSRSYKSFSVTAPGISHTKQGKGCEDISLHYPREDRSGAPLTIAVVADGHGDANCFRSAKGAVFAAIAAKDGILEFVNRLRPVGLRKILGLKQWPPKEVFEQFLHDLVKHIIASWHGKVEDHYTAHPVTDEELAKVDEKYQKKYHAGKDLHHAYGTTLIAAAITEAYWFGIHLGDGRFTALYEDGAFDQPVPWDERCYLNVTTSLCDDDALERARIYLAPTAEKPPLAIFLCSDGVDDTYPVRENEQHLYRLYRTIALTFVEEGFESTCTQLKDLAYAFATKGKGDDTSIAGIIDLEGLQGIAPGLRKQVDEEKSGVDMQSAEQAAAVTGVPEQRAPRQSVSPILAGEKPLMKITPLEPLKRQGAEYRKHRVPPKTSGLDQYGDFIRQEHKDR